MVNIFDFDDYKRFLRAQIAENKGIKAYQSVLSQTIGCQKPFLSQVLHSEVHLNADHAARLAKYWGLSTEESEYFVDLLLYDRAGNSELKTILKERMIRARKKRTEPTERLKWPNLLGSEAEVIYYSSWHYSAIHILVNIPEFRSESDIARRLDLPAAVVRKTLGWLEEQKLIRKEKKGGWTVTENLLHLPKGSFMNSSHQLSWRQKAAKSIQHQGPESLHYAGVFGVSRADYPKLKEMLTSSLSALLKTIEPSEPEQLVCLNCDLFEVK